MKAKSVFDVMRNNPLLIPDDQLIKLFKGESIILYEYEAIKEQDVYKRQLKRLDIVVHELKARKLYESIKDIGDVKKQVREERKHFDEVKREIEQLKDDEYSKSRYEELITILALKLLSDRLPDEELYTEIAEYLQSLMDNDVVDHGDGDTDLNYMLEMM